MRNAGRFPGVLNLCVGSKRQNSLLCCFNRLRRLRRDLLQKCQKLIHMSDSLITLPYEIRLEPYRQTKPSATWKILTRFISLVLDV